MFFGNFITIYFCGMIFFDKYDLPCAAPETDNAVVLKTDYQTFSGETLSNDEFYTLMTVPSHKRTAFVQAHEKQIINIDGYYLKNVL
jgi:hypothetical protein